MAVIPVLLVFEPGDPIIFIGTETGVRIQVGTLTVPDGRALADALGLAVAGPGAVSLPGAAGVSFAQGGSVAFGAGGQVAFGDDNGVT